MMLADFLTVSFAYFICYYYCRFLVLPLFSHLGIKSFILYYVLIVCVYMPVLLLFGIYRSVWRIAQAKEYFLCCVASVTAGVIYFGLSRLIFRGMRIPFYFYLLLTCAVSLLLFTIRLIYRIIRTGAQPGRNSPYTVHRAVIIGTGRVAAALIAEIENTAYCNIRPLAAVSAEPEPQAKSIFGIPVCGDIGDLPDVCRENGADLIIIAADPAQTGDILRRISDADCEIAILPPRAHLDGLRRATPDELCGGDLLSPPGGAESEISGRNILVCGAEDAFAAPLAAIIARMSPAHLTVTDCDADALAAVRAAVPENLLPLCTFGLSCDGFRSEAAFRSVLCLYKPEVVIFSASSRRVTAGIEPTPSPAVTADTLYGCAASCGVRTFLALTNPGSSGETDAWRTAADTDTASMRRILLELPPSSGESGGMADSIRYSLDKGLPVSLSRAEATGCISASDEACLILDALLRACGGEAYTALPGSAVIPEELARRMARLYGRKIRSVQQPDTCGTPDRITPDGIPALRLLPDDRGETKKEDTDNENKR